jgi:hypothetical protein
MFAYLRINASITDDAARLATGLLGSALTGRDSHPLDDSSEFQGGIINPPIPSDQHCLVASGGGQTNSNRFLYTNDNRRLSALRFTR